jgi:hypothetical protein
VATAPSGTYAVGYQPIGPDGVMASPKFRTQLEDEIRPEFQTALAQ